MNTWLEVDTFALIHNVRVIRRSIGDLPIWAVVKGNAFGHGLQLVSESLWRGGVDGWVVTDPEDAKWLSEQRYKLPILVLYPVNEDQLPQAFSLGWHLGVTSTDYFERIAHLAMVRQKTVPVQLEIETGMHRTGISPIEAEQIIIKSAESKGRAKVMGIYTHLYHVTDRDISLKQIGIMEELLFNLNRRGITTPQTHVLASEGLALYGQKNSFDAVRLGCSLYGYCPHYPETASALTWKTKIINLGELPAGETIGYESTYLAKRKIRVATLPVGYTDGLDRRLSNKGFVIIRGRLCPIIGRISMNHTMVDLSGLLKTELGEEVVLLGKQRNEEISLAHITEWAGIHDDEFVSRISPAIKRIKSK